jgi:hypothetical protein
LTTTRGRGEEEEDDIREMDQRERDSGLVKQEQQATLGKLMNECKDE